MERHARVTPSLSVRDEMATAAMRIRRPAAIGLLTSELMEYKCAECGCLVERGIRVLVCAEPNCCCGDLPAREDR